MKILNVLFFSSLMKRIENEESMPNAENEMWNTAKEESTRRNDENAGKREHGGKWKL